MTTAATILPRQSTPLERAIDQAMPAWDGLAEAIRPAGAGLVGSEPAAFLPWLAAEWGVAEFAAYFDTVAELLEAAQPWLLERGTAAAVRRALGWLGYDLVVIEEDGPYLHIDLGEVATAAQIQHVARVVRSSIPAHVRFYRVFHGYDLRHLVLDGGQPLDGALLDNDSGVWVDTDTGEAVKASFAFGHANQVSAWPHQPVATGQLARRGMTLPLSDRMRLDSWRLDNPVVNDTYAGVGAVRTGICNAPNPGAPVGYLPGHTSHGVWGVAAWAAPAPAQTLTTTRAALLPSTHPRRGWTGAWDATPWRPSIDSKHSQE